MAPISSGAGFGVNRLDGLGDADGEKPSRMERLTQGRVIDPKVPRHRVDPEPLGGVRTRSMALWTLSSKGNT